MDDRIDVCRKHLDFSIRWKGNHVGIVEMRRHYSNYFKGISHFKEFRMRLVTSMNYEEIISILEEVSVFYGQEEMKVLG
jgi:tRNA-dihydrouridine synthase B